MNTSIPLFIEPIDFSSEKIAGTKLSDNIKNWDREIIEHIHADYPFLAKVPFEVFFKKKDDQLGYAQGGIRLKVGKARLVVPLIIQKRQMAPLDVIMIGEDQVEPLDEENLLKLIQKHGSMGKLVDKQNPGIVARHLGQDAEGSHGMFPPNYGKYTYASLSSKVPSALEADMNFFRDAIEKNASFQAGFVANDTVEALARAAKIPTVKSIEKMSSFTRVKGNVLDDIDMNFEPLTKTAGAIIVDRKHGAHEGIFIDTVESLDGEKQAQSVFIGNDGYWAYQEKVAGKSTSVAFNNVPSDFSIGDEICFTKVANDMLVAIEPMQILSKTSEDGVVKIAARTHIGNPVHAVITEKVASLQETSHGYIIPASYGIIKLGKRVFAMEDDDVLQKTAMARMSPNLSYLRCIGRNYSFENEKVGGFHQAYEPEAIQSLSEYYTNAEELVKVASKKGRVIISGISDMEKVSSARVPKAIKMDWNERVKLASALTDADSVDAILSLGFVNEENLQSYLDSVPDLERAVSALARLLVAVRLGVKGDETACKMAMKYLQRVINSLKGISG